MKKFMCEDFLLQTETAKKLYHEYSKEMPIYDYHCHLDPKEIAENKRFKNIAEAWLSGDHYKWRAMRSNGVEEKYITGDAQDYDKFIKWAETIENCIGNPLYHWTHLELQRYFDIYEPLSSETADSIWKKCNKMLQAGDFSARDLIEKSNVKVICTTDDPIDDLRYHKEIAEDTTFKTKVLPTFRPDKGINIEKDTFLPWVKKLENIVEFKINKFEDMKRALISRIEYFNNIGCRISDHSLEPPVYVEYDEKEIAEIFSKKISRIKLSQPEINKYKTAVLIFLGKEYARLDWAMQIHVGVERNNNSNKFKSIGVDAGFDTISDVNYLSPLTKFMDTLDYTGELPRTIIYNLNPRDNDLIAALIGCFQSEIAGKIQFGSAWWFNDHKEGMEKQIRTLATHSVLGNFVGMLTDSRSFLSYTRHEYFRRVLCNVIGQWVEKGEFPDDEKVLARIVKNVSYDNAVGYFKI